MEHVIGRLTGLLAVLLIFGGIPASFVLAYYFSRKAKHGERIALIEKGVEPSLFMHEETPSYVALMWGSLIFGIGLGAFLGYLLSDLAFGGQEYMMPTLALVFGGLGLICYYIYRKKTEVRSAQ